MMHIFIMIVFPLSKYNYFLQNYFSFKHWLLLNSELEFKPSGVAVREFIQDVRMCGVRMFKILRQVFASYLRDFIYIKSNVPFIHYQCMCITLWFSHKKRLCFLSDQKKWLLSPNLTLFTCTSCFQLPASTCRTWSNCTEIGSCFTNKQGSDLGLRQKAASVRSKNLASI